MMGATLAAERPPYSYPSQAADADTPQRSFTPQISTSNVVGDSPACPSAKALDVVARIIATEPNTGEHNPPSAINTELAYSRDGQMSEEVDDPVEREIALVPTTERRKSRFCCRMSKDLARLGVTADNKWHIPPGVQLTPIEGPWLLDLYRQSKKGVSVCNQFPQLRTGMWWRLIH